MNPGVPENNNDAPIYVSSGESSVLDDFSNVSCQTEQSVVGNVNQEAMEGEVNSYSYFYKPFDPAKMVYYGEKEHIKAIQVPFAVSPARNSKAQSSQQRPRNRNHKTQRTPKPSAKRNDNARRASPELSTNRNDNAQRGSPQQSTNRQGGTNNMPNEAPGVQPQGVDVSLSMEVSGLRRSARKRNDAIYNEDLLADRLPRLSRPSGSTIARKPSPVHCLRMKASNHYPYDSDLDGSDPDSDSDSDSDSEPESESESESE